MNTDSGETAYTGIMKQFLCLLVFMVTSSAGVSAAPLTYVLDQADSTVGYSVPFGPDRISGVFPVIRSDVVIDFQRASASRVSVELDVTDSQASFPFATQALRGPKVLDAAHYPRISFVSRNIRQIGSQGLKAEIGGDITIRDVTRPILLEAEVFRPRDTPEGFRDRLSVHLHGAVSRSAFGATGWSDMVGDEVTLDMVLRIDLVE